MLIFASQIVLVVLTYYASFLLRLDVDLDAANRRLVLENAPVSSSADQAGAVLSVRINAWLVALCGDEDLLDISKASFLSSSLIFCLVEGVFRVPGYPRSVVVIDLFLTIMVLGGARFAVRAYTERARSRRRPARHSDCRCGRSRQRHRTRVEAEFQPELQPGGAGGRRSEQERRQDSRRQGFGEHRRVA